MTTDLLAPATIKAEAAVNSTGITLTDTGFDLSAGFSTAAEQFLYLAIKDHADTPLPEKPSFSGRKVVRLTSTVGQSHVACGTDDSLRLGGAHSLEWFGSLEFEDRIRDSWAALMIRGGTVGNASITVGDGTANTYQMGLGVIAPNDFSLSWSGPQVAVIVGDRFTRDGDIRKTWRSGILIPYGVPTHWLVTHDGSGVWRLYRNGKLVKFRRYDMAGIATANTQSLTGRPMVLGGIYSGNAYRYGQRMSIVGARVYNRALTTAECVARYRRLGLNDTTAADVTSGLVEEWLAANASGNSMPATVNAANNGTIVGGVVLTMP